MSAAATKRKASIRESHVVAGMAEARMLVHWLYTTALAPTSKDAIMARTMAREALARWKEEAAK
jgi:hypothetical protein